MDSITIIILVCIVLALIISFYFINRRLSIPNRKDKEKGLEYLESIRDSLYKSMIDIVANYDYKKFDNIADLNMDIIYNLTIFAKSTIANKISIAVGENTITSLIAKSIDDVTVDKFINNIIDKLNIEETIQTSLSDTFKDSCKDNEKLEEEINKEFDSDNFFIDEEVDESTELEEQNYEIPEEELNTLNPPREEGEEPFDPDTMEIIEENDISNEEDNTEDILEEIKKEISYDSKGRARDKSGRFIKVNKEVE